MRHWSLDSAWTLSLSAKRRMERKADVNGEVVDPRSRGGCRRHDAGNLRLEVLADIPGLRRQREEAKDRVVETDSNLVARRIVGRQHVRRLAAVPAFQVVERHTAFDIRPKSRRARN